MKLYYMRDGKDVYVDGVDFVKYAETNFPDVIFAFNGTTPEEYKLLAIIAKHRFISLEN